MSDILDVASRVKYVIEILEGNRRGAQKVFAENINCDPSRVSGWIKGRVKPSSMYLHRMEDAYSINPRWVLEGAGQVFLSEIRKDSSISDKLEQLFLANKNFDDLPEELHHEAVALFEIDEENAFLRRASGSHFLRRSRIDGEIGLIFRNNMIFSKYDVDDIITASPISLKALKKNIPYLVFWSEGVSIRYVTKLSKNEYVLRDEPKRNAKKTVVDDNSLVAYEIRSEFKSRGRLGMVLSTLLTAISFSISFYPFIGRILVKNFSGWMDVFDQSIASHIIPSMFLCALSLWFLELFQCERFVKNHCTVSKNIILKTFRIKKE